MTHTFILRDPKAPGKTQIMFSCYFHDVKKKFKYSTGEQIEPKYWNKKTHRVKKTKETTNIFNAINAQLNRHQKAFEDAESDCKKANISLTPELLREAMDKEFKKVYKPKGFFDYYQMFLADNPTWSESTVKKYRVYMNLLKRYEKETDTLAVVDKVEKALRLLSDLEVEYKDLLTVFRHFGWDRDPYKPDRNQFAPWKLNERVQRIKNLQEYRKQQKLATQE